ncbi:MAG: hypothetical protein NXH82_10380 [Rhodobacteraceae bacterium]|nr:hypothetical protein [Paracoccaceae bacterium]
MTSNKETGLSDTEVTLMLLRAILDQKDPTIQAALISKLGSGAMAERAAHCMREMSLAGISELLRGSGPGVQARTVPPRLN